LRLIAGRYRCWCLLPRAEADDIDDVAGQMALDARLTTFVVVQTICWVGKVTHRQMYCSRSFDRPPTLQHNIIKSVINDHDVTDVRVTSQLAMSREADPVDTPIRMSKNYQVKKLKRLKVTLLT